ncbi:hypothetical protein CARUB_v10010004mg [Capsella rubella]|uniref:Uncharacterized protein n=1 Tax=Capsella rubella TaxID=81985 RepID=R0IFE5_9BRAS|nr:hypothetical protein CARUB_v10010004mg [Capsella rubella]
MVYWARRVRLSYWVVGCTTPSLDTPCHQPPHLIKRRRLLSLVVRSVDCSTFSINTSLLPFPQVCSSSSLPVSSTFGSFWMVGKSVALVLWNSDLVSTSLMVLDTIVSTFVLSCGTLIALVRTFTAICRLYLEVALLGSVLWQFKKRSLLSFFVPDFLVHRGFYSPHLSFQKLIILPNTSLVCSGIVIGSMVVKIVLLAEARIVVQDGYRSTFVDCLTQETLFPFGDSPLSISVFMSNVVDLNLPSYPISLLVVVLVVWALCSFVVSSVGGG